MSSFNEEQNAISEQNITNEQMSIAQNPEKSNNISKILLYCLSGISIVISIVSLYFVFSLNKEIDLLKKQNTALEASIGVVTKENETLKSDLTTSYDRIDRLYDDFIFSKLGIVLSDAGIATDSIYINKAVLYNSDGKINGYIDIDPQPLYSDYFKGHGKIEMADREIKAMLTDMIERIKNVAINSDIADKFDLSSCTISITHNNYSIADYIDGELILSGE